MLEYDTLLAKLDFFSHLLALEWMDHDYADFERVFDIAAQALPPGAIAQAYVVGPAGVPLYGISAEGEIPFRDYMAYSLADREYFQVHTHQELAQAFISPPVVDRNSGDWVLQLSRGLWRDGRFQGVLLLNVSVRHASEALQAIFEDSSDVAYVVREDGIFL